MSGCNRRQRLASWLPKPASPTSFRPPSGSVSQIATATAPSPPRASPSSALATALPEAAVSIAALARLTLGMPEPAGSPGGS
jgi:hypothetical protein